MIFLDQSQFITACTERIATNEIASVYMTFLDKRLRQMAFFRVYQSWQTMAFKFICQIEKFINNKSFLCRGLLILVIKNKEISCCRVSV